MKQIESHRVMPLFQRIAQLVAWQPAIAKFIIQKDEEIRRMEGYLPHGSGFDAGCHINLDESTPSNVVIDFSYHHMDEMGGYIGWTEHQLTITPNLCHGFDIEITGQGYEDLDHCSYEDLDDSDYDPVDDHPEPYYKKLEDDLDYFYQCFDCLDELVFAYAQWKDEYYIKPWTVKEFLSNLVGHGISFIDYHEVQMCLEVFDSSLSINDHIFIRPKHYGRRFLCLQ